MQIQSTFSGFSVNDLEAAKKFYREKFGCEFRDQTDGTNMTLPGGAMVWMYVKENHEPATYTMLNFVVDNIDGAVDELTSKGIEFKHYPGSPQDEKGIMRGKEHDMGPNIAWFTDPAGNILSVVEL